MGAARQRMPPKSIHRIRGIRIDQAVAVRKDSTPQPFPQRHSQPLSTHIAGDICILAVVPRFKRLFKDFPSTEMIAARFAPAIFDSTK
jgi:hypothetical protein